LRRGIAGDPAAPREKPLEFPAPVKPLLSRLGERRTQGIENLFGDSLAHRTFASLPGGIVTNKMTGDNLKRETQPFSGKPKAPAREPAPSACR